MSQCHVHAVPGRDVACPTPSHHRLLPRANFCRALRRCPVTLSRDTATCRCISRANSCRALCPNSTAPTLRNRTSDPDTLSILSLLACHHSSAALSIHLSLPHWSSPPHFTFPSMTCVLKRFLLASPPKLPLTCVKRGFLRTAEPH